MAPARSWQAIGCVTNTDVINHVVVDLIIGPRQNNAIPRPDSPAGDVVDAVLRITLLLGASVELDLRRHRRS